jgi:peptidoglycan/LPS O-acetylase OafA/YrhL
MYTVGLTSLYLGFGGLLLIFVVSPSAPSHWASRLALSAAATVGRHSYSIYLWHVAVLVAGVPLAARLVGHPVGTLGEVLVYFLGSCGAGIIMARLIEFPSLRIRDRYFAPRERGLSA